MAGFSSDPDDSRLNNVVVSCCIVSSASSCSFVVLVVSVSSASLRSGGHVVIPDLTQDRENEREPTLHVVVNVVFRCCCIVSCGTTVR